MKILVRATNWIGDAIMSIPALRAIRKRHPEAEMGIVARPSVVDLYRNQDLCDELIPYGTREVHKGIGGREKLAADLRRRKFDVAVLLQNAFDAAWLAWRAGIPQRIGYARDGRSLLLTRKVLVPKAGEIPSHEQFYYLELLRRAGWIDGLPAESFIRLAVSREAEGRAADILTSGQARGNVRRIAIGAGASYGSAKCWPPARFAEFVNRFRAAGDVDVVLFGTPAESEVAAAIAAGISGPSLNLTGKTSMTDLPALLSKCDLFVGNDSGAMHVAAAVGVPVVAIFGPTDPQGTVPVTPDCTVVQQKPYCSPCFLRRCPTDHRCMTAVTPAMVENAARLRLYPAEVRSA